MKDKMLLKTVMSEKVYLVIRVIIGGIFLYSGIVKLFHLNGFSEVISAYGLVPSGMTDFFAFLISLAEVAAGAGLIADLSGALSSIALMLTVFMGVLLYGIAMGFDIDCGCFGENDPVGNAFHSLKTALVRDGFMMAAVVYLFLWRKIQKHHPVSLFNLNILTKERKSLS